MVFSISTTASLTQLSLSILSVSPNKQQLSPSSKTLNHGVFPTRFSPSQSNLAFCFPSAISGPVSKRGLSSICFYNAGEESNGKSGSYWQILKRWDVPWKWQTISLTSLACGLRISNFVLTGLIETAAIPYLGLQITELSLDEKAEILFVDQTITTAVVLAVMYSLTNYQPLDDDFFRYVAYVIKIPSILTTRIIIASCPYNVYIVGCFLIALSVETYLREPFNLQKGWLLWAGFGLVGALMAIALTGVALSLFSGETPERETDALVRLLPLIGSSSISTACLVGITGVLAPLLEETVFRGFFMVSLTKWLPTPLAVLISASVFAIAHLTPGEFPQLFVLGAALGFSYAQTRNLLTPITIHAVWNSGVILLLTFLQLQGYDIKELLQAT
ncbi:hypothetical protein LguiA_032638 [Lonicera macranthoides]